jgi:uncharacterized SAM-binding protein YcdF (DUF218 family)
MDPQAAGVRRARRRTRLLAGLTLVVVPLIVSSLRLFVWPSLDPPGRVDAVLVFAGGDGERQAEGARLVRSGVASVLVISDGGDSSSPSARACAQRSDIHVTCITPPTSSTRGEARAFGALAERERWRSVVAVTSTYHLTRARLALGRCYGGMVASVTVPPAGPAIGLPLKILREWAGLLAAGTVQRGC